MRINVIGHSGSGKTTLARGLATLLGCPFHELDNLHWGPNWTPRPREELRQKVSELVQQPAWVVDGNYADHVRDLIWPNADLVVWLDFSLPRILLQLIGRTAKRLSRREKMWESGNTENLREAVFGWNSLLIFALREHFPRRRQNLEQLTLPGAPSYHRICSPSERELWWEQFSMSSPSQEKKSGHRSSA